MTLFRECACSNQCPQCGGCCAASCEHRAVAHTFTQPVSPPNMQTYSGLRSPPPAPPLTEERVREIVSFEVQRQLRSAYGALADRVAALENGALSTVHAQIDAALERVAGQIVKGLVGDQFPQYRDDGDENG